VVVAGFAAVFEAGAGYFAGCLDPVDFIFY
jgi:hypothetical protein